MLGQTPVRPNAKHTPAPRVCPLYQDIDSDQPRIKLDDGSELVGTYTEPLGSILFYERCKATAAGPSDGQADASQQGAAATVEYRGTCESKLVFTRVASRPGQGAGPRPVPEAGQPRGQAGHPVTMPGPPPPAPTPATAPSRASPAPADVPAAPLAQVGGGSAPDAAATTGQAEDVAQAPAATGEGRGAAEAPATGT